LDTFDTRLFCLLRDCYFEPTSSFDRRPSPHDVAKMLRVDIKTVRKRMKSWERSGFVKYYQVIPNYNLLGIKASTYLFHFPDVMSKTKGLAKIGLVDGVGSVLDLLGESALVWLGYQDEEEQETKLALLEELTGDSKPRRFMEEVHPEVNLSMVQLDWQILKSMRHNALKPLTDISGELGVTRKTVRAHLSRMADKRAFFIRAIFDVRRVTGLTFYGLALRLDSEKRKEAISKIDSIITCGDNCFMRFVTPSGDAFLGLWSKDLMSIENTYVQAKQIPGVNEAEIWLYKEVHDYPKFLDKLIEKQALDSKAQRELVTSVMIKRN
jgi:DNA-binding Lrp family transcriptional regulator